MSPNGPEVFCVCVFVRPWGSKCWIGSWCTSMARWPARAARQKFILSDVKNQFVCIYSWTQPRRLVSLDSTDSRYHFTNSKFNWTSLGRVGQRCDRWRGSISGSVVGSRLGLRCGIQMCQQQPGAACLLLPHLSVWIVCSWQHVWLSPDTQPRCCWSSLQHKVI